MRATIALVALWGCEPESEAPSVGERQLTAMSAASDRHEEKLAILHEGWRDLKWGSAPEKGMRRVKAPVWVNEEERAQGVKVYSRPSDEMSLGEGYPLQYIHYNYWADGLYGVDVVTGPYNAKKLLKSKYGPPSPIGNSIDFGLWSSSKVSLSLSYAAGEWSRISYALKSVSEEIRLTIRRAKGEKKKKASEGL